MIKYLGKEVTPTRMKLIRWNKKLESLLNSYKNTPKDCSAYHYLFGQIEVVQQVIAELNMEVTLEENPDLYKDLIKDIKEIQNKIC